MAGTYTATTEDAAGTGRAWFQDCEISPATLADGSLYQRFDTRLYPSKGITGDPAAGNTAVALQASNTAPVHATSVTLTATVTSKGVDRIPSGTVQFKDGAGNLSTPQTLNAQGVATLVVAGGFTAGAHSITAVYSGDSKNPAATSSVVTVTAS